MIEINPDHAEGWINRGHMLVELHREAECLAAYRQAHTLMPHHQDPTYNEALNLLRLGDFKCAWEKYELRWFIRLSWRSSNK
jgi:hypothetical protein